MNITYESIFTILRERSLYTMLFYLILPHANIFNFCYPYFFYEVMCWEVQTRKVCEHLENKVKTKTIYINLLASRK